MSTKEVWRRFLQNPKDGWYYVQGSVRQWLWKNFPKLIRPHIREQYLYRLRMARVCARNGSCICCGCKTPDLFFSGKACSLASKPLCNDPRYRGLGKPFEKLGNQTKPCYPEMKNAKQWQIFKANKKIWA